MRFWRRKRRSVIEQAEDALREASEQANLYERIIRDEEALDAILGGIWMSGLRIHAEELDRAIMEGR